MKEARLYRTLDNKNVSCFLCAHHCAIAPGNFGKCSVRKNIDGKLFTFAYGKTIAENADPVEKKPLYHFLPGSKSYSIATMGCNFRCGFCQNWQISQISEEMMGERRGIESSPEEIVARAIRSGSKSISYTYTEPTIFLEYASEIAFSGKERGLANIFVTNGFMTAEALKAVGPVLDACNVDLKSFSDEFYRKNCGARVKPVLETLERIKEMGVWLEITTLLIPGENDSEEELRSIGEFIAGLDRNIPWHVSRFFPQYQFGDLSATPVSTLELALEIGYQAGLKYVYPGNIPGESNTVCFNCKEILIRRTGFSIGEMKIKDSRCPNCGEFICGIWS